MLLHQKEERALVSSYRYDLIVAEIDREKGRSKCLVVESRKAVKEISVQKQMFHCEVSLRKQQ